MAVIRDFTLLQPLLECRLVPTVVVLSDFRNQIFILKLHFNPGVPDMEYTESRLNKDNQGNHVTENQTTAVFMMREPF